MLKLIHPSSSSSSSSLRIISQQYLKEKKSKLPIVTIDLQWVDANLHLQDPKPAVSTKKL